VALRHVLSHVDEAELVALTRDLIRLPSVVRPGDPQMTEAAVASYVERWFTREGFGLEVQEVAPGRPNVLAWHGERGDGPALLLEGHTDVVTEGDPAGWTHPPFAAHVADGRIYGRGAADMKGGLAAAMIAAAAIKRSGAAIDGCLIVGALVDEERDMLGAKHLCDTAIGRELTAAIICEPEDNELCLEQRGVIWARVVARGRMAHGAMPEAGANPIHAIAALVRESRVLERRLRAMCARSRYLRPPTVTPTVLSAPAHGLAQPNVIPGTAEAILDVRLTPGADEASISNEIDAACRRAAEQCRGVTLEWQSMNGFRNATRVDPAQPIVRAMVAGVRQATGARPRFGGVPGSTDGTILVSRLGIPIVTCGPGHRQIPHQANEYVEISQLVEAARIYAASALNFLQV
jgi:succinyl-diaminopimelate desuccinylase